VTIIAIAKKSPLKMPSPPTKRSAAAVLESPNFVVAAAFALRMVLLWLSHRHEDLSNPRFETIGLEARLVAYSLAQGKGFFGPYPGYEAITACIAPVYPFLWAIGIKLFHLGPFGATIFSQVMNCAFSAATCWPIFAIGKKVFGEKTGIASAWLWGLLPYAVLMPLEWTWDQSLAALVLALIVQSTFALRESDSSLHWTGYGLLWAFAALVNPTLCLLLPFFLAWLVWRKRPIGGGTLALAARAFFVFVLALLPWTIRNYYAIDGLVFVKSNFGMELWLGNNPAVKNMYTPELHPINDLSQRISLIMAGEPNYNRARQRQAIAYIENHPRTFLNHLGDRFADTWAATYDAQVEPWILALHLSRADVWFCAAFSVSSFAGLIFALLETWADSLPLAICLILFPIPYYLTHTAIRYRHPIDPFMTIFTIFAAMKLRALFQKRPRSEYSDSLR
jgi:4-amino-4-deoxy-L-arabinose transferase-like glycosyltransferase